MKCLKCGHEIEVEKIELNNGKTFKIFKKCSICNTVNNAKDYYPLMYKNTILNYLKDRLHKEEDREIIGIDKDYDDEVNMKYGAINILEEVIHHIETCMPVKGE